MHIHFICRGNSFRSRLAEAYLASLKLKDIQVSSSGTMARNDLSGQCSANVLEVAKSEGVGEFFKRHWDQLTQEKLEGVDIVICMNRNVYREANKLVTLPLRTIVWDVSDLNEVYPFWQKFPKSWVISHERATYYRIQRKMHDFLGVLYHKPPREAIEMLDAQGKPTGVRSTIQEANEKALWHMVAHIVIYNENQEVLLVRRSKTIIGSPGLWEVGLGGSADYGETPEMAAVREVGEEIGVTLAASALIPGGTWKYSRYLPHYGFHSRALVYNFAAKLPADTTFALQESEADQVRWVSIAEVKTALRSGKGEFGQLVYQLSYYRRLINLVESLR